MKLSPAPIPPGPLDRKKAWSCLLSNLAMPGIGSLTAGHAIGRAQLLFGIGGFALTTICGLRFIFWFLANQNRLEHSTDPLDNLQEIWLAVRWALLGIAVFAVGILWALATSVRIVRESRRNSPPPLRSARR